MKVRIHWETKDGCSDSLILSGNIEDIRKQAADEIKARGGINTWSEVLEE